MEKISLTPYLFFDGNCREAMEFYKNVLGGELTIQTYGEVDKSCPEATKDKVMHAALMDGTADLMASDSPSNQSLGTGKISLTLSGYDEGKLREMFDQLSDGGKVTSALKKEFWGDIFGTFTDKYGVDWMVNVGTKK